MKLQNKTSVLFHVPRLFGQLYENGCDLITNDGYARGVWGGRPYKKPNERICPLCKKEAEDEKHFLVSCPGYQEKRKSLFECLSTKFKIPIGKMSTENIFLLLLNPPSNNIELQKIIAKHVHECYEIRKKKKRR